MTPRHRPLSGFTLERTAAPLLLLSLLVACSSNDTARRAPDGNASDNGAGTGGSAPASGGSTTTGGATAAGGAGGSFEPGIGPSTLPFAVDDYFIPSGYMGDAEVGHVTMTGGECERAHAEAIGDCHDVSYTLADQNWAGIFWQYPLDNWGARPGLLVPAGASRVAFYAKGAAGGERITFQVGGLREEGRAYGDLLAVDEIMTLTTTWQKFELSLNGSYYVDVIGGFAWIAGGDENPTSPLSFQIDDIRWE